MVAAIVCAIALGLLAWLLLGGRGEAPEPTAGRRAGGGIDYAALEQAEREVQEAKDADAVRDWGPGAGAAPPPLA